MGDKGEVAFLVKEISQTIRMNIFSEYLLSGIRIFIKILFSVPQSEKIGTIWGTWVLVVSSCQRHVLP